MASFRDAFMSMYRYRYRAQELVAKRYDRRPPQGPGETSHGELGGTKIEEGEWCYCAAGSWGWYRRMAGDFYPPWRRCGLGNKCGCGNSPLDVFPPELNDAMVSAYLVGGPDACVALLARSSG